MESSVRNDGPHASPRSLRIAAWFLLVGGLLMAIGPVLPYSGSDIGFHAGYTNEGESAALLFGAYYSVGGMILFALAAGAIAVSSVSSLSSTSRRALRRIGAFAVLIALLCLPFVWYDRVQVSQRVDMGYDAGSGIALSVSGMVLSLLSSLTLLVLSIGVWLRPIGRPLAGSGTR